MELGEGDSVQRGIGCLGKGREPSRLIAENAGDCGEQLGAVGRRLPKKRRKTLKCRFKVVADQKFHADKIISFQSTG